MENYTYFYCNSKNIEAKNGNACLNKKNEKKMETLKKQNQQKCRTRPIKQNIIIYRAKTICTITASY